MENENELLSKITTLTKAQHLQLKNAYPEFRTLSDLILIAPSEIAKRCKIPILEARALVNDACKGVFESPACLEVRVPDTAEIFTSGDKDLDNALAGGIGTGMVWEIAGESASGKTQLALQLALFVQIPRVSGGLEGSACYVTTFVKLQTDRLLQIMENHPKLTPEVCSLSHVHTIRAFSVSILLEILSVKVQGLTSDLAARSLPRLKLIIIDSLADLFRTTDKISSQSLAERSKDILEVSTLLHFLAAKHAIAIIVINDANDAFVTDVVGRTSLTSNDVYYADQVQWFGKAHNVIAESRKEAALGLVWANQVNTRIILTRTGRRRYLAKKGKDLSSRPQSVTNYLATSRAAEDPDAENAVLIRRLTIVFSSITQPSSLDFIVSECGFETISE